MLDEHIAEENFGLLPVIDILGIRFSSYTFFMVLAFVAAFICYKLTAVKLDKENSGNRVLVIVFALLGGIVGAKLPILLYNYKYLLIYPQNINLLISGRTIIGGLIGGVVTVYLVKRHLKIQIRTGNDIAAPAALGMAVGRVGCLLGGCCFGIISPQWAGINLGNGVYRYPTQIYEIIFDLSMFAIFLYLKKTKDLRPGILFRYLLNSYLIFRFFLEFIRDTDNLLPGISYYQAICILCLLFINRKIIKGIFTKTERGYLWKTKKTI